MKRTVTILAAISLAACTSTEKQPTSDTAIQQTAPQPPDTVATPVDTTTPAAPSPQPSGNWIVTPKGIGAVTAGMTLVQANAALGNDLAIPAKLEECDYIRPKSGPKGIAFMVQQRRISRVDISEGDVATSTGARIGDTEAKIQSLYPGQVAVQPHKYTDGHYLVVTPANPADSAYRIVFETDGSKVLRFRSGRLPAVQYVEGCS